MPSRDGTRRANARRVPTRLALIVAAAICGCGSGGCGSWQEPASLSAASRAHDRDRPDDEDAAALVPAGVETVIDVDIAALRRSLWTAAALETSDARAHSAKVEALGYDDIADLDRIIYAVSQAGAEAPTLVVARGRFQAARVQEAFRARWPDSVVDRWRGIPVLASGENAIALVTPRTFVSGSPTSVRSVVDRAFGVGADVGADAALGPMRRALLPEGQSGSPAVLATIAIGDRVRARVGDAVPLPRELRLVGLRLDVGQSFDLQALGILDDRDAAAALARRLGALMGDRDTRLALRAMGLDPLLSAARITLEGARVRFRTSVSEDHRAEMKESLRRLLGSLRGQTPEPGGQGSW